MTPLPEDLYEELERHLVDVQQRSLRSENTSSSQHSSRNNPEIEALASLAQRLQTAPPLQVDPTFAHRLEKRVLARNEVLQGSRTTRKGWNWSVFGFSRARSAVVLALCLFIVVIITGTGVLVASAQVSDPSNPLYVVKRWEQQVQVSFASSSTNQAELHLQFAREQLTTLGTFTDASHAPSYQQALANFDQQMTLATQEIQALPAGANQNRLNRELAALQTDARQTLRGLLSELTVSERVLTTNELGRLGETVSSLTQAEVTLPAQPNGQASVSISGSHFQPGAQLLVNGQPVAASGAVLNGMYLFTVQWHGNQHPHSIGILNPDGTAAQTTQISIQTSNDNGNDKGNGNGDGNGKGNGGGKIAGTPGRSPTRTASCYV